MDICRENNWGETLSSTSRVNTPPHYLEQIVDLSLHDWYLQRQIHNDLG